jgi:capsular polysaccharide transport system permease protein
VVSGQTFKPTAPDSAFTVQCRVVYALMLRDVKSRFGGRRLGFVWALLEPCFFIGLFVAIFYLIGRTSQSGLPLPLFFVTGFTPFLMFRNIYMTISDETKGDSPMLMFPQVTRIDLIVAKVIVNVLLSITVLILLLSGCYLMGFTFRLDNPLGVLRAMSLLVLMGLGLGLVIGSLVIRYEFISSITQALFGRPLLLTSGLFFTAEMLPPKAREYLLYNPLLHLIESLRSEMFEGFGSRYVDLPYATNFAIVLVGFGFMMLMFFDRQRR